MFDNQAPEEWRAELLNLIENTPHLDWLLLTKRPQNIRKMIAPTWNYGAPMNVWFGTTTENQEQFDARWRHLRDIPAKVRFISYEPALGPLSLPRSNQPDWVIAGGESGAHARPIDPAWVRGVRDECEREGIAFHFKQWGGVKPKSNGKELDGREWCDFPVASRRLSSIDSAAPENGKD